MNAAITRHTLKDRWVGVAVGAVAIVVTLAWALDIYAQMDVSAFSDLPAGVLEALGMRPGDTTMAGMAYGAMLYMMGAMVLAGLAVSIGAASIAGEERDGTIGVLLGTPVGRLTVLTAKLVAMVVLVVAGGLVMLAGGLLAPTLVGANVSSADVTAIMVHLTANALVFGTVAAAVGAVTGNRSLAGGGTAGLMVLSYLVATIGVMFDGGEAVAKASPWYWFQGHAPDTNGVAWGWLALQVGVVVAASVVAGVGLVRRDLRAGRGRTSLLERLKRHRGVQAALGRIAGRTQTSSLQAKVLGERRTVLIVCAQVMFVLGLYYAAIYNFLPESFKQAFSDLPASLMAVVGQADLATPAGFLQAEMFSLTLPITATAVLISHGANALAGEEDAGTMDLLLGAPVSRQRVLVAKAVALVVHGIVLGAATCAGVIVGVLAFGFDITIANLAATTLLTVLLATGFGAVAFAVSAATGKVRAGVLAGAGVAGMSWFVNSFLRLSEGMDWLVGLSPFHWMMGNDPLNNGLLLGDLLALIAVPVAAFALAVPAFTSRDLK